MMYLCMPILVAFAAYALFAIRRNGLFTADSIFAYIQLLMAVGSIPLLDEDVPADRLYAAIIVYTYCAFVCGSLVFHFGRGSIRHDASSVIVSRDSAVLWLGFFVSAAIALAYFRAVGYSALFRGLANAAGGGSEDVAGLRLESYGGSRYLFPGYVNQFKNVFLPSFTLLILTAWWHRGSLRPFRAVVLVVLATFALLGTGQRGAFVMFGVVVTVYIYFLDRTAFARRGAVVLALMVPVIVMSTLALGRTTSNLGVEVGLGQRSTRALTEFGNRIIGDNQLAAVEGFRYIHDLPVTNGGEWKKALGGVLPGSRGTDLPNRISAQMYGNPRGTAPPSLWGSIYHNFGTTGVLVAPWLLAVLLGSITVCGARPQARSTIELIGIAGTFTVVGFWAAGDPTYLLNTGIAAYIGLWLVGARRRVYRLNQEQGRARRGPPPVRSPVLLRSGAAEPTG